MVGLYFTLSLFILSYVHPLTNALLFYLNTVRKKSYLKSVSRYKLNNIINLFIAAISPFLIIIFFIFTPSEDIGVMFGLLVGIGMFFRLLLLPADIYLLIYKASKEEIYKSQENALKLLKKYLIIQATVLIIFEVVPLFVTSVFK